jgi:hypothetical protein
VILSVRRVILTLVHRLFIQTKKGSSWCVLRNMKSLKYYSAITEVTEALTHNQR